MTVPGLLELQSDGNDVENNIAFLNHTVGGGKGADYLQAGSDACTLLGEQGNDILIGRDSGDYISGGLGHDTISGGSGGDILFGDAGDDDMSGDEGNDELYGSSGTTSWTAGVVATFCLAQAAGTS
jgi:Ca2+-binding RTX toxin-like protein